MSEGDRIWGVKPAAPAAATEQPSDFERAADRIYSNGASPPPGAHVAPAPADPSPPPAPVSPPAPAPAPEPARGLSIEAIAAGVPDSVKELRAAPGYRLWSGQEALTKALPDEMFADDSVEPKVQQAVAREVRAMAADIGFNPADIATVRTALARVNETPPTEEQRIGNREQIVEAMNAKYGRNAHQAWLDARKFVAADPRRAAALAPAGDDPAVVLRLVELAQAAKRAGRLR